MPLRTRRRSASATDGPNFWPGMADMILAALIIALLLFFGVSVVDLLTRGRLAEQVRRLEVREAQLRENERRLAEALARINEMLVQHSQLEDRLNTNEQARKEAEAQMLKLREELRQAKSTGDMLDILQKRIAELEQLLNTLSASKAVLVQDLEKEKRKHDKPPNITLSEKENYTFDTGKAELTEDFKRLLREKAFPKLIENFQKYPVEVIEIIGHTDRQSAGQHESNLDKKLLPFLEGREPLSNLSYGSNADLGLMRAAAVREYLRAFLTAAAGGRVGALYPVPSDLKTRLDSLTPEQRAGLGRVQILPYSAAQAVPAEGTLPSTGEDSAADRRIEIRFTRLRD